MLIQFTVENYLSFREKVVFSMRASKHKDHPGHVIAGRVPTVRGAAIYGANAAGKSNLVLAMGFARDLLAARTRATTTIAGVRPFGLRENEGRPSNFSWFFQHAGRIWNYNLSLTTERVLEESLFSREVSGGGEKKWFERETDAAGKPTVSIGKAFRDAGPSDDAKLLALIGSRVEPDKLFLHLCRDNKVAAVEPVFEWFEDVLTIVRAEEDYEPLVLEAAEDEGLLRFLSQNVRDVGTGIAEVEKIWTKMSDELVTKMPSEVQQVLADLQPGETTLKFVSQRWKNKWTAYRRTESGDLIGMALLMWRRGLGGEKYNLLPMDESEGTQRYLHLLPRLYQLQTRPTVLIIDELERRLHTLLTRRLVQQALDGAGQAESQFLFTTHDTNLLDAELLRRDEVWFVDKDAGGASSLTSLAEFDIRSDSDYEKGYLLGRFEGIPYLRPASTSGAPAREEAPAEA